MAQELALLVETFREERDRLLVEHAALAAARRGVCGVVVDLCDLVDLDPGELQTRMNATMTMVASIESFIAVVFRAEAAAEAGDDELGASVFAAASRAFPAITSTSPVREAGADLAKTARGIKRDLEKAAKKATRIGALGGVLFLVGAGAVLAGRATR